MLLNVGKRKREKIYDITLAKILSSIDIKKKLVIHENNHITRFQSIFYIRIFLSATWIRVRALLLQTQSRMCLI
jgi:hypothetical protein